jgi:hypothetical protein
MRSESATQSLRHYSRAQMKISFTILSVILLATACQTTSKTTNRIAVGMTETEVLLSLGKPYSKSAQLENGVPTEKWIYKETTWDQGGWSWNRTVSDSAITFQNGKVVSYGLEKERHLHQNPMNRGINVNVSHDD